MAGDSNMEVSVKGRGPGRKKNMGERAQVMWGWPAREMQERCDNIGQAWTCANDGSVACAPVSARG